MSHAQNLPHQAKSDDFRLSDFIRHNVEPIVREWIAFARTRTPASETMTRLGLQDHIVEILGFIAADLETRQTPKEQADKSKGLGPPDSPLTQSAAEVHAQLRLADGFNIDQMVSEYRALRSSVVRLWTARDEPLAKTDLEDLTRFNEAIDQALAESVAQYTKLISDSRSLFLGILGHDLRNPIGSASMAAQMMGRKQLSDDKKAELTSQIVITMERATHILDDLLDITRKSFGREIPLVRTEMNMGELALQLAEEMRSLSKGREIKVDVSGDCAGAWDRGRMGQLLSNLIGNAVQYSFEGTRIVVTVADQSDTILISVRNEGPTISAETIKTIFDAMTRGPAAVNNPRSANLGLGLHISKLLVVAHGGTIDVASSAELGTTFTVVLPRR
ncbi:signal transduction histidine kinase [Rhodoligotrophos appendicifer]|uniref:sensor histidine kinase n=1 Tax=Rhodoligotrophos appendicifer TaxID=987056 RepID=UPI001FE3CC28|nr:HAMP domain-containing sensor histidine kinase [Rhodoligotrophos appendicifer]